MVAAPLRVGVLGCGRIGRMHAELLTHRVAGTELVAVHDAVEVLGTTLAEELGVQALDTAEQVFAAGVDAVAICTSTDTHVELITAAAEAGVAIFCEKPISLDLDAVDRALAAVDEAGVLLHVGFNRRFDPAHASVQQAAASGRLGQLHLVRITSRDPSPPPIGYIERSGGLFLDMTIHDLDMARFVTGSEVVEVYADGGVRIDPAIGAAGDIDTAVVQLRHADGCLTVIDNSRACAYGYDQRVEAFGSTGMAASENQAVHGGVSYDGAGSHAPPVAHFFLERYGPSYVRQWEAFVDAVVGGGPAPVSGADGRAPLVLGIAAGRSLAEHRPIAISPAPVVSGSSQRVDRDGDPSTIVSASRLIAADHVAIFEWIADPARQPDWDGNDNLAEAATGQRVRRVGDTFTTTLTHGATRVNHVVEFVEGLVVAWQPSEPGHQPPGHLWRWQLEPQSEGETLVVHTYDWTRLSDPDRLERARSTTAERLHASLDRLAALVEAPR